MLPSPACNSTTDGPSIAATRLFGPVTRLLGAVVLLLLKGYKLAVSPWFAGSCRYYPSCSNYMAEAVVRHGVWRGSWLGFRRLMRCHPLGGHGVDPVPHA